MDPITLIKSETDKLFGSSQMMSDTVLENISPDEYHKQQLQTQDKIDQERKESRKSEDKEYDANENLVKINKAFKSIEINGQILKYKFGKIDKDRLRSIIEESFLICFRLVRYLVEDLSNEETKDLLIDHFLDYFLKDEKYREQKIPTREELYKLISKTLSNITYYICHYTLDRSASHLGNISLIDLYHEISEKIGTPAARLTYALIKFKFNQTLDKTELVELEAEFRENSFAYSILQKAAINFIYMHKMDHSDKSWIASKLNIHVQKQRKIENMKNR